MDQFSQGRPDAGSDDGHQREAERDSLFLSADFQPDGAGEPVRVRIRNLSAGGLMAEFAEPIALGTTVEIELRGIGRIGGRIAWAAAGRVGVAFDRDIDPKKARKPVGGGTRTPSYVKPPLLRR